MGSVIRLRDRYPGLPRNRWSIRRLFHGFCLAWAAFIASLALTIPPDPPQPFPPEPSPPLAKAAGNYLNSILATQESKRNGYDESILLDMSGNVSEASGENIFLVRRGRIYTPYFADSALEGITRESAIKIAKDIGYEVTERPIPRTELYMADEIFLTGTAAEIVPVTGVDGHTVGTGKEGPVTKGIREMYAKVVSAGAKDYMDWLTPVW